MKKKIYLACPYSHPDEEVRKQRFKLACKWAYKLTGDYIVYSPLSHSVPIAHYGGRNYTDHKKWMEQCLPWLKLCDEFFILCLPGWEHSRGIQEEIQVWGKSVHYITNAQKG